MYKKVYFKSLPSTNQYLKDNYSLYADKTVIICSEQTQGRGRFGRVWEMEPGKNLAFSILLKPNLPFEDISRISLIASAAMFQVLKPLATDVMIKWPNDLLIGRKKVCGILLESILSNKVDALIIGIGLNLNGTRVPSHLINKATSLTLITGEEYDRDEIISNFLDKFDLLIQDFIDGGSKFLDICRKQSSIIGKNVTINNQEVKVLDILDNGNLLVSNQERTMELAFGEVTIGYDY